MSAELLSNPSALAVVLSMLSANDTSVIKRGEGLLKPFLKKSHCVLALVYQIKQSNDMNIRHHAALLLKRKVSSAFLKLDANRQNELKVDLLQLLLVQQNTQVGIALAGAVAALAKSVLSLPGNSWPEMFQLLLALSQDSNEVHRRLLFSLLAQLAEHVSSHLKPHTTTVCQLFVQGCQDPIPAVALEALSSTSAYIRAIAMHEEVLLLKPVLPPLLTVLGNCLQRKEEDAVVEGFELIQECCSMEFPLINDFVESVVAMLIAVVLNESCEDAMKQAAESTLIAVFENRPKLVAKKNLVTPCLNAFVTIIANDKHSSTETLFNASSRVIAGGNDEDSEDDEDYTPGDIQRVAQTCLDSMAMHIPSKHFVQPAFAIIQQCWTSADPHFRKAGCMTMGVIAEGCCDDIRQTLANIIPKIVEMVRDPEECVREAACFALGQFSEYCQPEILHYHQSVLPAVFQALDNTKAMIPCYVIEMFCENLQPETLRPFLNPMMTKLATLLQTSTDSTGHIHEMVLSAIAATAVAAEIDFLPYAATLCTMLAGLLFNSEPEKRAVRGRALECLGHVAVAIGSENFAPYFETGMQSAMQGIAMDDLELKEYSYVYFANCAKVMGRSFNTFLPTLVPHLLETINESEVQFAEEDEEEDAEAAQAAGEDQGDEEEWQEEDGDDYRINVEEGFINSKKAALTALGSLAEHTKESFGPYVMDSMLTILDSDCGSLTSVHGLIRGESLFVLQYMLAAACAADGLGSYKPVRGVSTQLPDRVTHVATQVLHTCVHVLMTDDDKTAVSNACEVVVAVLKLLGVSAISLHDETGKLFADLLMNAILALLSEKAPCQETNGDHQDDGDEEHGDHDNLVMDGTTDLVSALAQAIGPDFAQYFNAFHACLMKFLNPSRPHSDRSMAMGCYAEVLMELGPNSAQYINTLLPHVQAGLADPMESVRRNTAFCIVAIVDSTGPMMTDAGLVMQLLQWLYPVCVRHPTQLTGDTGGADVDNALSAVAKMISKIPSGIMPLAQVLPVLLSSLPLRVDPLEGPGIYGCLIQLIRSGDAAAMSLLPQMLTTLGEVLVCTTKIMTDETKALVSTAIKEFAQSPQLQGPLTAALGQISNPEIVKALQVAAS